MPADTHERTFGITKRVSVAGAQADLRALGGTGAYPRAIKVGGSGNVVGQLVDDTADITESFDAGVWHLVSFKSITSMTATGVLLGY